VLLCYRLFRAKYSPADATGAYRAGGRWNAKGIHMLYASTTLSLACLEILVHIKEPRLPADYVWVRIHVPAEQMDEPLREGDFSDESLCRQLGSDWVRNSRRAAIEVPSVIVATEGNLLLNPRNPGIC
jgi:RES domain-containing protein